MLSLMTIIGISGSRLALLEQQIAANMDDGQRAMLVAECAASKARSAIDNGEITHATFATASHIDSNETQISPCNTSAVAGQTPTTAKYRVWLQENSTTTYTIKAYGNKPGGESCVSITYHKPAGSPNYTIKANSWNKC